MILIADSGSTKTDWACLEKDGSGRINFKSRGYNPNYISGEEIQKDILASLPQELDRSKVKEVYFYGAGVSELQYDFMRATLKGVFTEADEVFVAMDLLASARALLGHEPGFAAILGTGTNSCLFDGENITLNVDSLGFILGDEGSGGYIGKALIRDYIRGNVPEHLMPELKELIGMNGDELINQIYTKPSPNRFCAQFCTFVGDSRHRDSYYYNLMKGAFRDFFREIVSHYPDYQNYTFTSVGSVGYHYQDLLKEVAEEFGMKVGRIIKAPMDGLVEYHTQS